MIRTGTLILAAVVLTACATGPVSTGPSRLPPPGTVSPQSPGGNNDPAQNQPVSTATNALLLQSRTERDAGDLGRAAATIERALSIAPEDASLWLELAEIRLDQGNRPLAEEMARKALTLTPDGSTVADRARRLLSR